MDLGIAGRRALIVGASQGLGFAAAEAIAREGAYVYLVARNEAALSERSAHVGAAGFLAGDITEPGVPTNAVDGAVRAMGGLDILVTNAGSPAAGGFLSVSLDDWSDAYQLTLMSAVRLCRAALPYLQASPAGRILMITSVAVREPLPDYLLHSTFMTAATATAKALSREVASAGVTVNTVQPGYILTERNSGAFREHAAAHGMGHQEAIAEAGEAIPAGRLGQVAEFGPLCAFLCSDRARYITGQSIGVDGGLVRCLQ